MNSLFKFDDFNLSEEVKFRRRRKRLRGKNRVPNANVSNQNEEKLEKYLLFNGNKLSYMEGVKEIKSWPAVSGRTFYLPWTNFMKRIQLSHSDWSKAKNEGPTPQGKYTLGIEQYQPGSDWLNKSTTELKWAMNIATTYSSEWNKKYGDENHDFGNKTVAAQMAWGNYRYSLIPTKGTNTFGRGSMYLHGGSFPGSIGCIDLTTTVNDFAKWYKDWLKENDKTTITLVVDYKTFSNTANIIHQGLPYKISSNVVQKIYQNPNQWSWDTLTMAKNILITKKYTIPKDWPKQN